MGAWLIKSGQVAGAVTALITAGALIWTQVKSSPTPAPTKLKAKVTTPVVFPNRSWLSYFNGHPGSGQLERKRAEFRAHGLHNSEIDELLKQTGFSFEFKVEVEAPAGTKFSQTTALYRMPSETAVSPLDGSLPSETFETHAGEEGYESEEDGWIEYPAQRGKYLLEIDLVSKDGYNVGKGRSREFLIP